MVELAASIAREINQPLTAIVSNASAALRWLDHQPIEMDAAREAIRRISEEGKCAGVIIERARSLTRRTPSVRESVGLGEVVQEVVALLAIEAQKWQVSLEQEIAQAYRDQASVP
jgi:Signal transduction histidine kinase regulating C4-dicarboxylate transport system